jgi:heat shock protein HslJ
MKRFLAAAALLALGACAAPGGPASGAAASGIDPAALMGTRWVGAVGGSVDRRAVPRLEFVREGRLTGFTGCNLLSGAWRREGGQVLLGPVATTKRMCLGPEGELEKRVLAAMVDGSRVTVSGDRLLLESPTGARFEFDGAPSSGY